MPKLNVMLPVFVIYTVHIKLLVCVPYRKLVCETKQHRSTRSTRWAAGGDTLNFRSRMFDPFPQSVSIDVKGLQIRTKWHLINKMPLWFKYVVQAKVPQLVESMNPPILRRQSYKHTHTHMWSIIVPNWVTISEYPISDVYYICNAPLCIEFKA